MVIAPYNPNRNTVFFMLVHFDGCHKSNLKRRFTTHTKVPKSIKGKEFPGLWPSELPEFFVWHPTLPIGWRHGFL